MVGADLDSADGFCERFGLGSDGALLVRPDGHIAWRREAGTVTDAVAALRAAVAVATGCSAREEGTVEVPAMVA
jgi:putative polyketide hydroxylase